MKLNVLCSDRTNPYWNVAVENYLVSLPSSEVVTMYLWKNRRTVVIGQNQNPFSECNVDLLLADGGYVMRRTTGGGAVYHDDGNINFSFVAPYELYDQAKQFDVICRAVRELGLDAELSGRNDLLCNGRKFSGNAFSKGKYNRLHHGTILIDGNIDDLKRYLKVKPAKLHKHGVQSVQNRVVNLSELTDVSSDSIVPNLVRAFEDVYGCHAETQDFSSVVCQPEVVELYGKYSSDEWLYGKWRQFTVSKSAQFEWGGVEMYITVDEQRGVIGDVEIATDALEVTLPEAVKKLLTGASVSSSPNIDNSSPLAGMLNNIVDVVYGEL